MMRYAGGSLCAALALACSPAAEGNDSLSGGATETSPAGSDAGSGAGDPGDADQGGPSDTGPAQSCTDPSFVCAPEVPSGWQGPVSLGRGSAAPACAGEYPTVALEASAGLQDAEIECANCACGAIAGLECVPADEVQGLPGGFALYSDNNCQTEGTSHTLLAADECTELTAPMGPGSSWLAVGQPGGAPRCAPSGGEATLEDIAWLTHAVACEGATAAGSCGGTGMCMPPPPEGFEAGVCVYQDGDVECPADYPERLAFFTGADDTRSCSACACDPPEAIDCMTTAELYTDADCSTLMTIVKAGDCNTTNPAGVPAAAIFKAAEVSGQCSNSGGDPEGTVTPRDPVTVCCV